MSWKMRNLRTIKFMSSLSTEWWTWLIRAGCGWMRPEKAPEFHDPCRSLGTEGGRSNLAAKLSPRMLLLGSNNSYITVQNLCS